MKIGEIFSKEPARDASGLRRGWDHAMHKSSTSEVQTSGLVAGTKVATALGWRKIEAIQEGDKVLTFDDGLQTVIRVERRRIFVGHPVSRDADSPIHIPAGALGNGDPLSILPDQPVMVESDLGEQMFGDPFTLVPALSLIGFKGIERTREVGEVEVITLRFEHEEVIFANVGALFYCPAAKHADLLDMVSETYAPGYEILSPEKARRFVEAMIGEDTQDALWAQAAAENRPLHVVA